MFISRLWPFKKHQLTWCKFPFLFVKLGIASNWYDNSYVQSNISLYAILRSLHRDFISLLKLNQTASVVRFFQEESTTRIEENVLAMLKNTHFHSRHSSSFFLSLLREVAFRSMIMTLGWFGWWKNKSSEDQELIESRFFLFSLISCVQRRYQWQRSLTRRVSFGINVRRKLGGQILS